MSEILHTLLLLDEKLFFWVNLSLAHPLWDGIMMFVTNKENWYLPGGGIWILLIWKGGKEGRVLGIMIIFALILADQISASILKPLVGRDRPCKVLEGFRLLVHCGSWNGFPSSHASNISALATLFIYYYRKTTIFWLILAILIGISRVYLGVHYPGDVVAGWLLGMLIAIGLIQLYHQIIEKKLFPLQGKSSEQIV